MRSAIERYVIRHLSGSKANQVEEFDFSKSELKIGRAADSNIQFDPETDVMVSREHGKIVKDGAEPPEFSIHDNNSRNGIFVNKNRVKGVNILKPGDEVQLGNNGPVFVFDIFPRPQDMMMATRVVEIPTSIKPTTISEVQPAEVVSSEPVKTGLGKQTVERMLVAERKKSTSKMAIVIGSVIAIAGIMGFVFRDKLFANKNTYIGGDTTVVVTDPKLKGKKSPDEIAKENDDKVVQIEFGWQLFDPSTSDELWHKYIPLTDEKGKLILDQGGNPIWQALYIENGQGGIEPFIDIKKNITDGAPVGSPGGTGSGFVVSPDGFILTNRHVGAAWNTSYLYPQDAFPGALLRYVNGKPTVIPSAVSIEHVYSWVPAEAKMVGGKPGSVKGRNTYCNVIFSGTSLRRPVQSSTPSDVHDVALLKVEIPESLSSVTMKDVEQIKPGQSVTVMGYPGVAPQQYVVRKTNDPFNVNNQFTSIPTPTVTPGNIGRIIPASSEKDNLYSSFGDSYQLTINATGGGNSGGPMFDDEGNVIGIYYAGKRDQRGTQISFAVPIKYGLELMGRKKVNNR